MKLAVYLVILTTLFSPSLSYSSEQVQTETKIVKIRQLIPPYQARTPEDCIQEMFCMWLEFQHLATNTNRPLNERKVSKWNGQIKLAVRAESEQQKTIIKNRFQQFAEFPFEISFVRRV